jgi:hypothetical protein
MEPASVQVREREPAYLWRKAGHRNHNEGFERAYQTVNCSGLARVWVHIEALKLVQPVGKKAVKMVNFAYKRG